MMLRKVVIPTAGLGTRLLPATKEQSKEMLPVFASGVNGVLCVKPFLQVVFEQLYDAGFKDFCLIVGRGKKGIEDHFTIDNNLIQQLLHRSQFELQKELIEFYKKLRGSNISFINQPEPRGFGDAVFRAKNFTGNEPFLVHAGDDLVLSKSSNPPTKRLVQIFENQSADAVFYVEKVGDPRKYGVITGKKADSNLYQVTKIEEKPSSPASNLAVIAIYAFSPEIYNAIEKTRPDVHNEIQLTSAIQHLIDDGFAVYALKVEKGETRIDIGTAESYWKVLKTTRNRQTIS